LVYENGKLTHYRLKISEREFDKTNTVPFGHPEYETLNVECNGEALHHVGILRAFVNKLSGEGELYAKGEEGINGLSISNAMHLSAWLGKTITLPIDEELFLSELNKKRGV
jgi:hypothetical protein